MLTRRLKSVPASAHRKSLESLEARLLFAEVAETLLVDVDATTQAEGPADVIANAGTLGGVFEARGGGDMVPVFGRPVANATAGSTGLRFDGNDYLALVQEQFGELLLAPAGLTGVDATSSVEAWVWNPGLAGEETVVAWGKRGGPEGTNASFNYGSDARWGAIGRWGAPDIGWGPTNPVARQWHHLAWTYDGTTTRVYVDGVMVNSEVLGPGVINTHPDTPLNIASQTDADGLTPTGVLRATMTIGKVRVHDGVLTDAQVLANYNAERASFVEPVVDPGPGDPPVKLVDIDATNLTEGDPADAIPNTGSLGGFFNATGGGDTVPVIDQPTATAESGTRGIRLDGNDYLQHVDADGVLIPAPEGIVGTATSSIEVWVWNPGLAPEETMVAWGWRGGPDGSNYSFNYGSNGDFGAMGHWGPADIGWGPTNPVARQWHHLVYTWDNVTQKVYVDGVLANSEILGEGALNVHAGAPINIGTQLEADGLTPTTPLRGSLTLGKVRVYDGVLPESTITANYNAERGSFVEPVEPPPPPAVKLVDVDATNLPAGSAANNIPNTGSLGGVFEATGGEGTIPVIGPPLTSATTGTRGIRLDGNDFLQLVSEPGVLIPAPASITGVDPKRSVEAWVYNPGLANEETILSWGRRGGPDGTNFSFNYGSNNAWGAVGHWGAQDIGYGATDPSAQNWHHLAYTYDGNTSRVYVDGAVVNTELLGEGAINTFPDTAISLGTQLEPDAFTPTNLLRGSMTLGKVRIYEGVLTDEQIATNFNTERTDFVNPNSPAPADLTEGPVHRYSFNNPTGDAATGTVIEDVVGDQDATVLGAGATFTGSRLVLPGGPSASAAYVDLQNGILSKFGMLNPDGTPNANGTGQVTFEGWIRHTGNQPWSRIYDFGLSTAGEVIEPGGAGNGVDFFMLTAQTGGDPIRRFEITDNDDGDGTGNRWDEVTGTLPQDLHFAVTWDEVTGEVKYYENGREVGGMPSPILISAINDVNNWLGRSNFLADPNFQGEFDEFRIYDRALTGGEVLGNFQAGADVVTGGGIRVVNVFARGSTWQGNDNNAANTTFMELLQARDLGSATYGYRIPSRDPGSEDLLPWINANQIVIEYSGGLAGAPAPSIFVIDGVRRDYQVTAVTLLDPTHVLLTLDQPLGGNPATTSTNGDRFTLTVNGGGSGGGNFQRRFNVVQGDVNRSGSVLANDYSEVKARFFQNSNQPAFSPFHDVDGSGSVLANDYSAVKARFFHALPAVQAAAAVAGAGAGVTKDLFSSAAIL